MSKFFVGQRVRVKYADAFGATMHIGAETRIRDEYLGPTYEAWQVDIPHPEGGYWNVPKYAASECLEPILPSGHRAGDFTNVQDLLDSLTQEHA